MPKKLFNQIYFLFQKKKIKRVLINFFKVILMKSKFKKQIQKNKNKMIKKTDKDNNKFYLPKLLSLNKKNPLLISTKIIHYLSLKMAHLKFFNHKKISLKILKFKKIYLKSKKILALREKIN